MNTSLKPLAESHASSAAVAASSLLEWLTKRTAMRCSHSRSPPQSSHVGTLGKLQQSRRDAGDQPRARKTGPALLECTLQSIQSQGIKLQCERFTTVFSH